MIDGVRNEEDLVGKQWIWTLIAGLAFCWLWLSCVDKTSQVLPGSLRLANYRQLACITLMLLGLPT